MTYEQTVHYLCNELPYFQKSGKKAYKENLDNTLALANLWGNPQDKLKTIHVAGTNGKGSSCHMLANILEAAGYKTGLYTSPHILDFRERIRVNSNMIHPDFVVDFVEGSKAFIESNQPTFFELTTIMAFAYFAQEKVDIAVIEVGLGGRLDCTNIIHPEVALITQIGLDHIGILGNDLSGIAKEKAGIIKKNIPVVLQPNKSEVIKSVQEIGKQNKASVYLITEKDYSSEFQPPLAGSHQIINLAGVLKVCQLLNNFDIKDEHIRKGLNKMKEEQSLQARYQTIQESPKVILDTAHNEDAWTALLEQIKQEEYRKLRFVIGFMQDKEVDKIITMLPKDAVYYFTAAKNPRALYPTHLKEKAKSKKIEGEEFGKIKLAYETALKEANNDDLIVVAGSFFMAEAVLGRIGM